MRTFDIVVEMDGALAESGECWRMELLRRYGVEPAIHTWDALTMGESYPGLTPEQIYGVLERGELWERVRPTPGSRRGVSKLLHEGHRLKILVSAHYLGLKNRALWLKRYFPALPAGALLCLNDRELLRADLYVGGGPRLELRLGERLMKRGASLGPAGAGRWEGVVKYVAALAQTKCPFQETGKNRFGQFRCIYCVHSAESGGVLACRRQGYADFEEE